MSREAVSAAQRASGPGTALKPLAGLLVVALEQGIAAPYCSSRLADAGARVIKVEFPEGDAARDDDHAVFGVSSSFVWTNRGKESIALDLEREDDRSLLDRMIARADVFIHSRAPGSSARSDLDAQALRVRHPALVTCGIEGFGERDDGPCRAHAQELLVQAESGLLELGGVLDGRQPIGVPLCEVSAGLSALAGIQQALLMRERSGAGSHVEVSLFDAAAELMGTRYLQARHRRGATGCASLAPASVAPCGAFTCADGREIVILIRSEPEWAGFCREVLRDPALADDPRFRGNAARLARRDELHARIAALFASLTAAEAIDRLTSAEIAYGSVNSVWDLIEHPQLRTRRMALGRRSIQVPVSPWRCEWDDEVFRAAPGLDEHGLRLRAEFGEAAQRPTAQRGGASRPPTEHPPRIIDRS